MATQHTCVVPSCVTGRVPVANEVPREVTRAWSPLLRCINNSHFEVSIQNIVIQFQLSASIKHHPMYEKLQVIFINRSDNMNVVANVMHEFFHQQKLHSKASIHSHVKRSPSTWVASTTCLPIVQYLHISCPDFNHSQHGESLLFGGVYQIILWNPNQPTVKLLGLGLDTPATKIPCCPCTFWPR